MLSQQYVQEAERPQSSLPILPLFEVEEPHAKAAGRAALGSKEQYRADGGGLTVAVQSTPEEQSARTGQDMGAP